MGDMSDYFNHPRSDRLFMTHMDTGRRYKGEKFDPEAVMPGGATDFGESLYHDGYGWHEASEILCPKCESSGMIERENKKGKKFLGCLSFPKCKGSRTIKLQDEI